MDAASNSPALLLAVISGFLLFAGGFWTIVCLGQWALAPLERVSPVAAAGPPTTAVPLQFSVLEFLLLMVQVQLGVLAARWGSGGDFRISLLVGGCVASVLGLTWWNAVQRLASAEVKGRARRVFFVALIAPLNVAATIGAMVVNAIAVFQLLSDGQVRYIAWLAGNLGIAVTFVICRGLTNWVMRSEPVSPTPASACFIEGGAQSVSSSGTLG